MCPQRPDPGLQQLGQGFTPGSVQAVVAGVRVLAVRPGTVTHRGGERAEEPAAASLAAPADIDQSGAADERLRSNQISMRLLWADETPHWTAFRQHIGLPIPR